MQTTKTKTTRFPELTASIAAAHERALLADKRGDDAAAEHWAARANELRYELRARE